MRRFRDRRPSTMFRGAELPRLMTMIVMLGVLVMLMSRAKNPATWSMFGGDGQAVITAADLPPLKNSVGDRSVPATPPLKAQPSQDDPPNELAAGGLPSSESSTGETESTGLDKSKPAEDGAPVATASEPAKPKGAAEGEAAERKPLPPELDPDEAAAAKAEFEAVTDKAKLSPAEMPAEWRLIRWADAQSPKALRQRARKDVLFTHLWEHPEKYRGELIQLRLHLRRLLSYEAEDEKSPGIKRLYEAWGWTDESKSEFYVVMSPTLPEGMPLGADVYEEVTFAGYFLKLLPYKSQEGKWRASPLLIGQFTWHPQEKVEASGAQEWQWGLVIGGGVLLLLFVLRWMPSFMPKTSPAPRPFSGAAVPPSDDTAPIEDWLEHAEETPPADETLESNGHDVSGGFATRPNGSARHASDRLDGGKDWDG